MPVYKTVQMSSFSVVSRIKKVLPNHTKVGHTGTLDRFAEGILVLLIGRKYTRLSNTFMAHRKVYRAILEFGYETDTLDPSGEPVAFSSHCPSLSAIEEAMQSFLGEIEQFPPCFSAKKFQGKRLSDWARAGQFVLPRKARVYIHHIELIRYAFSFLEFRVECSKGTYIRSLGRDLARKVFTRGNLVSLVREKNGPFSKENALDLEDLNREGLRAIQLRLQKVDY
ncbi:tRNA pseudouridine(55) synthase TruB [Candidatus Similichlamydia laticola]|uniref:tRNA pseudouridine(55) synthase TruB n=1 Tax=Candidatus Similichlamydia laticola TaxID=2170265 RepID=UPI002482473A|nr:tRNA pseudouridine(55) synthase TruB [Candidatus Similichlamydia laticola]